MKTLVIISPFFLLVASMFFFKSCSFGDQVDYSTPGPTSLVVQNASNSSIVCILSFESQSSPLKILIDAKSDALVIDPLVNPRQGRLKSIGIRLPDNSLRSLQVNQSGIDQNFRDLRVIYDGNKIGLHSQRKCLLITCPTLMGDAPRLGRDEKNGCQEGDVGSYC